MNNAYVVIYPDSFVSMSISADVALVNSSAKYQQLIEEAGFFKKAKLRKEYEKLKEDIVEVKRLLITNTGNSLVLPAELVSAINKFAMDGSVLSINGFTTKHGDDGLFEFGDPNGKDK